MSSYHSTKIILDPAAIVAAKQHLQTLIDSNSVDLAAFSLADGIAWLERQLPDMRDVVTLMTWANAVEQTADQTPDNPLWAQALKTEGYSLRLRARLLPSP